MKIEYAELEGVIVGMNHATTALHMVDEITAEECVYLANGATRILEILNSIDNSKNVGAGND